MDKDTFDKYRQNVILPYINDLQKIDNGNDRVLIYRPNRVNKIFKFYEEKRLEIRRFFMDEETKPMDRHKIGAVMIYATLKGKIFKVNRFIPNLKDELLMANEYLAVYLALSIVESYKRDELKTNDWLINVPDTYHDEKCSYINHLCKALYCISNIKYFDIFAYANILFMLEKYTDDTN